MSASLIAQMRAGNRLALARLISKIENRDTEVPALLAELYPYTGKAQVFGITGPPGAGKSTLVDQLIHGFRKHGQTVAVVAVDPSSPFSGGAILGDRIRMQAHTSDQGVYIRSLGTRGMHGGLSHSTKEVVLALDAAGFDAVLVETAGVGQTELNILKLAQTILVVLVPESGDSIQVMKAGLMEIADVFAVNKSDRPAADQLVKELINLVGMETPAPGAWVNPVLKTEALHGKGVQELLEALVAHQTHLRSTDLLAQKVRSFLKDEVQDILVERLQVTLTAAFETSSGQEALDKLARREMDPYQVADWIAR